MAELVWEKASSLAGEIRDTYRLHTPVDLQEVCDALGISVFLAPLEDNVSGVIVKEHGQDPNVAINSTDSPLRQRFTLAHELGHYIERIQVAEDEDFSFSDKRGGSYDLHEFFADEFAASLLMPAHEVKGQLKTGSSLFAMSQYFRVSPEAMRKRIDHLTQRDLLS